MHIAGAQCHGLHANRMRNERRPRWAWAARVDSMRGRIAVDYFGARCNCAWRNEFASGITGRAGAPQMAEPISLDFVVDSTRRIVALGASRSPLFAKKN